MAHDASKLAVLIDADNAQPSLAEGLLAEVAKYGTAHVKRAYGDWTSPQLRGWKDQLLTQSIQPIQQFGYTSGKNATDSAMIIDAMDLLYTNRFDGFCIVSSDSDFTRLAGRIRESGLFVYGFGERKTPTPFVAACDKFVYTDVLRRQEMVRLAEENLKSHQRIYDQISLRSARGVGRLADQDQAEARLAQARNNLLTEQTNLADARTNYLSVVGAEPLELSEPAGLPGLLPQDLQDARRQLLENSPILRSAESDVAAAEKQYEAAKAPFYPRFDAELSRNADNNLSGDPGHNNDWQAMLRMRYNLFAGGSNKAELQSKSYLANQALDVRNNALRQLNEELGLAWNALANARDQLPIARQYVDYSSRVREAYQKQFSIGERTLLDLLDSENELFNASRRLVDLRYTELFTQYRLKATLGELLKSQGVVAPLASVASEDVKPQVQLPGLN